MLVQSVVGVPVACAWACNYYLGTQGNPEPMYASAVVLLMAYVITAAFALVMSCTLDTLFVCTVRDKSEYKGAFMSDRLYAAYGFDPKERAEGGGGDDGDKGKGDKGKGDAHEKETKQTI